jgi:cytochrome P450
MAKWADDFLVTASKLNEAMTAFFMVYWQNHLHRINSMLEADEDGTRLRNAFLPFWMEMERGAWEVKKFSAFALDSGPKLEAAMEALMKYARDWMANGGGNVQVLRQMQLQFNSCVRVTHAEMLGLSRGDREQLQKLGATALQRFENETEVIRSQSSESRAEADGMIRSMVKGGQ